MVESLTERKRRETQAVQGNVASGDRLVSDESLFNELGASLKRVK